MVRIARWIAYGIGILCTGVIAAGLLLYVFVDQGKREQIAAIFSTPAESAPAAPEKSLAYDEWLAAYIQHFYIALPISRCFSGVNLLDSGSPQQIKMAFMIGRQVDGTYFFGQNTNQSPDINLNNYELSLIYLSDEISRARITAATDTISSKRIMNSYEWVLVAIGAITTILISVKSIANQQTPGYVTIGILAIIFSALGTAGTSLNSFFAPNDTFNKSERTLLQLHKLHNDLTAYVAAHSNDLCASMSAEGNDDPKSKATRDFWDRFGQIVSAPGSGVSQTPSAVPGSSPISPKP